MWDTIKELLLSPNATIILTFLIFVIIVGWILTKSGMLTVHTENVTIGAANAEREIIRQQVEWTKLHFEAMEAQLEKGDDYDAWRSKYVAECLYDEFVNWITFNHLNTSSAYIEVKQDKIINLLHSLPIRDEFRTQEFEEFLREDTKTSIEKLIRIRNVYKIQK